MNEPTHRIHEAYTATLRTAVMAALQIAEQIARHREELERAARVASEAQARRLAERLRAEREAAMPMMRQPWTDRWWSRSSPESIADTWRVTAAWAAHGDPYARAVLTHMRTQMRDRWGVEIPDIQAGPRDIVQLLAAARGPVDQADSARAVEEEFAGRAYRWTIRDMQAGGQVVDQGTAALLDGEAIELLAADQLVAFGQRGSDMTDRYRVELRPADASPDSPAVYALSGGQQQDVRVAVTERRWQIVAGADVGASPQEIRDALVAERRRLAAAAEREAADWHARPAEAGITYEWAVTFTESVAEQPRYVIKDEGTGAAPAGMTAQHYAAGKLADYARTAGHEPSGVPANWSASVYRRGADGEREFVASVSGDQLAQTLAEQEAAYQAARTAVEKARAEAAEQAAAEFEERQAAAREAIRQLNVRIAEQEANMRGENGARVAELYALRAALDEEWWATASAEEIAGVWQHVTEWEPGTARTEAAAMIEAGISSHVGVTVPPGASVEQVEQAVRDALEAASQAAPAPAPERASGGRAEAAEPGTPARYLWRVTGRDEDGQRQVIKEGDGVIGNGETPRETAARTLVANPVDVRYADVQVEVYRGDVPADELDQAAPVAVLPARVVLAAEEAPDAAEDGPEESAVEVDPARIARGERALAEARLHDPEGAEAVRVAAAGFPAPPEAAVAHGPRVQRASAPTAPRTVARQRQQAPRDR